MDSFLKTQYPKPSAAKNKNKPVEPNPNYDLNHRKKMWSGAIDDTILFVEALLHNLYGSEEGLFTKKYYKNHLPLYMMGIFNVKRWINIVGWDELQILVKNEQNLKGKIKNKFLNRADISREIGALIKYVKDRKIPALECMFNIRPTVFKNQLIVFISDALKKYVQFKAAEITEEQLMHKLLYNEGTHELCRVVKICVDVGWHNQPYEEYAESVAKIVGIKYNELSRRMRA